MNRTLKLLAGASALLLTSGALQAADPAAGSVSESANMTTWNGGAFVVSNPAGCTGPDDATCDNFMLTIEQPTTFSQFKVIVEIAPTALTPDSEDYDMFIYDSDEQRVGSSASGGGFERIALTAAGTYRVEVQPFLVTPGSTYTGQAVLLADDPPELAVVAPASAESIFSTPNMFDSQLHTGEPSIASSPVIPTDGSRPLIVGDAPWGTSNATSLWWRSRDGGASFELVQDPAAAPRPRPCEEIDGGGDSDTSIDENGHIYVNDLAALVNITVGESDDDFQTMNCSKVGGTNPIQAVQDRQWVVAAPDADGDGPAVDAYISFRSGLVGGNPVTEPSIQIYTTTDGGATYQPVGEIADFFGFDNNKLSQTGNPVVDFSDNPSRGTFYQAYYLGSTPKIGRYRVSTNTFEALTVADRSSDVGNVFTALAIDTEGNLYYSWIEGGSFDVLVTTSTDQGTTWRSPVRINLPGVSELAVNPYMIAGSPGRVTVIYNATDGGPDEQLSPDGAFGKRWFLFASQSINALDPKPVYTQYQVTDTSLHFNSICTSGLGCSLQTPEGDRSLLEFNEVDVDPSDGSMIFIFADNGRHSQPPLDQGDPNDPDDNEIPQPYIMFTRQIAGDSMLEGKTIVNDMPRQTFALDPVEDATYPKAGTAEGPNHPVFDIRGSHMEVTETGIRTHMAFADLSDLSTAFNVRYGTEDPRATAQAIWTTRFELVYDRDDGNGGLETREEVYATGMELGVAAAEPTFWYGPLGVFRNAGIKRSHYASDFGEVAASAALTCNTITVEVPFAYLGVDPAVGRTPELHSIVTFGMAQPEAQLNGMTVSAYFNNQRTVDQMRSYDWNIDQQAAQSSVAVAQVDNSNPDAAVEINFDGSGSTLGTAPEIDCLFWDFGDGTTGSGPMVTHSYADEGAYLVTLTVVDTLGFIATDTIEVIVGDEIIFRDGFEDTAR